MNDMNESFFQTLQLQQEFMQQEQERNELYDDATIERKVKIVWGAPASGKTTYVKQHKGDRDLVVDLDYLLNALILQTYKSNNKVILPFAFELRDYLYSLIENQEHYFNHAWIIATLPNKKQRMELVKRFNAELIHINTSMEECLHRANADKERVNKVENRKIIQKYFKELQH